MLEGGIRVPFIISYPAVISAGQVCDQPVTSLDLFVTFAKLADAPIDLKLGYPGIVLIPTWEGKLLSRGPIVWRWRTKAAVRYGSTKYIDMWEGEWKNIPAQKPNEAGLYDLDANPQELTENAIRDPRKAREMANYVSEWRNRFENKLLGRTQ
jgi:arylsulfatase A-like enzyme